MAAPSRQGLNGKRARLPSNFSELPWDPKQPPTAQTTGNEPSAANNTAAAPANDMAPPANNLRSAAPSPPPVFAVERSAYLARHNPRYAALGNPNPPRAQPPRVMGPPPARSKEADDDDVFGFNRVETGNRIRSRAPSPPQTRVYEGSDYLARLNPRYNNAPVANAPRTNRTRGAALTNSIVLDDSPPAEMASTGMRVPRSGRVGLPPSRRVLTPPPAFLPAPNSRPGEMGPPPVSRPRRAEMPPPPSRRSAQGEMPPPPALGQQHLMSPTTGPDTELRSSRINNTPVGEVVRREFSRPTPNSTRVPRIYTFTPAAGMAFAGQGPERRPSWHQVSDDPVTEEMDTASMPFPQAATRFPAGQRTGMPPVATQNGEESDLALTPSPVPEAVNMLGNVQPIQPTPSPAPSGSEGSPLFATPGPEDAAALRRQLEPLLPSTALPQAPPNFEPLADVSRIMREIRESPGWHGGRGYRPGRTLESYKSSTSPPPPPKQKKRKHDSMSSSSGVSTPARRRRRRSPSGMFVDIDDLQSSPEPDFPQPRGRAGERTSNVTNDTRQDRAMPLKETDSEQNEADREGDDGESQDEAGA